MGWLDLDVAAVAEDGGLGLRGQVEQVQPVPAVAVQQLAARLVELQPTISAMWRENVRSRWDKTQDLPINTSIVVDDSNLRE